MLNWARPPLALLALLVLLALLALLALLSDTPAPRPLGKGAEAGPRQHRPAAVPGGRRVFPG